MYFCYSGSVDNSACVFAWLSLCPDPVISFFRENDLCKANRAGCISSGNHRSLCRAYLFTVINRYVVIQSICGGTKCFHIRRGMYQHQVNRLSGRTAERMSCITSRAVDSRFFYFACIIIIQKCCCGKILERCTCFGKKAPVRKMRRVNEISVMKCDLISGSSQSFFCVGIHAVVIIVHVLIPVITVLVTPEARTIINMAITPSNSHIIRTAIAVIIPHVLEKGINSQFCCSVAISIIVKIIADPCCCQCFQRYWNIGHYTAVGLAWREFPVITVSNIYRPFEIAWPVNLRCLGHNSHVRHYCGKDHRQTDNKA